MKIALLGYGKMGKTIEHIAKKRGHSIVIKTSSSSGYNITDADIAIDFSVPTAAVQNISNCINNNVPVISGTTGWLDHYNTIEQLVTQKNGAFIYASNFSLGVNVFFELNKHLAKLMAKLDAYKPTIEEIHHTQKLDAPSGTAITLAEQIIETTNSLSDWVLDKKEANHLTINSKRIPDVPGTHEISYKSTIDTLSITHEAHNREGFALGAVIAAEWLIGKTGIFTMKDVLNIS